MENYKNALLECLGFQQTWTFIETLLEIEIVGVFCQFVCIPVSKICWHVIVHFSLNKGENKVICLTDLYHIFRPILNFLKKTKEKISKIIYAF